MEPFREPSLAASLPVPRPTNTTSLSSLCSPIPKLISRGTKRTKWFYLMRPWEQGEGGRFILYVQIKRQMWCVRSAENRRPVEVPGPLEDNNGQTLSLLHPQTQAAQCLRINSQSADEHKGAPLAQQAYSTMKQYKREAVSLLYCR